MLTRCFTCSPLPPRSLPWRRAEPGAASSFNISRDTTYHLVTGVPYSAEMADGVCTNKFIRGRLATFDSAEALAIVITGLGSTTEYLPPVPLWTGYVLDSNVRLHPRHPPPVASRHLPGDNHVARVCWYWLVGRARITRWETQTVCFRFTDTESGAGTGLAPDTATAWGPALDLDTPFV